MAIEMNMLKGSKLEQKLVLKMGRATFRNKCNYEVAAFEGLGLEIQNENDRRRARASSDPLPHLAPHTLENRSLRQWVQNGVVLSVVDVE